MPPSAQLSSPTMVESTPDTPPADLQAELQLLRERNRELQSQVDELAKQRGDSAVESPLNSREETSSSSSSLDSGLDNIERTKSLELPIEFGRSNSDLSNNSHNGLHHRRIPGKENSENQQQIEGSSSWSSSPSKLERGYVKAKVSDIEFTSSTPSRKSASPAAPKRKLLEHDETQLNKEDSGLDNGARSSIFRGKKTRRSSDGAGRYFKALSIDQGDEEAGHFPEIHVSTSDAGADIDTDEESEGLIDDDSHNKHISRLTPESPLRSSSISSTESNIFPPFKEQIKERAGWLIGLLFLQSCSSFIIQYNQSFLQKHMVIVQFLTMLVGAGGNAGNQASVGVIRSLAVGTLNQRTMKRFLIREAKMALSLSALIGFTGFIRAALFRTPPGETIAVTTSVCAIVLISVGIGSTLPLAMKKVGIDPAHSSTTIQVVMDILGVLITVCVSSFVLSFKAFQSDDTGGDGS